MTANGAYVAPGSLPSLIERLTDAEATLRAMAQSKADRADVDRLMAKRSGVLLALSYAEEEQRLALAANGSSGAS